MKRLHIDPLVNRVVLAVNNDTGTTVKTEVPMPWEHAAIVAGILTIAGYFIYFLTGYQYEQIVQNLGLFCFESIVYLGKQFFANFLGLAGLRTLMKRANSGGGEG